MFKIEGYNIIYKKGNINDSDGVMTYMHENICFDYKISNIENCRALNINGSGQYKYSAHRYLEAAINR